MIGRVDNKQYRGQVEQSVLVLNGYFFRTELLYQIYRGAQQDRRSILGEPGKVARIYSRDFHLGEESLSVMV